MNFRADPIAFINTSYAPVPAGSTLPQLEGPWAVARGEGLSIPNWLKTVLVIGSAAVSGFHGSRRNGGSIFWGLTWFSLGAIFPVVVPVVAAAQGFGDCKNSCPTRP
jgi:hypothetical protein